MIADSPDIEIKDEDKEKVYDDPDFVKKPRLPSKLS